KVEAGADFVQTRAVFDLERFGKWIKLVRQQESLQKTPILAGIIPLVSVEQAKALQEAPGMMVPDSLIQRLESSGKPEEEGIKIAKEILTQVKKTEGVRGIVLHAGGMESLVSDLIK
ncbi:MAG: methylenetetrahydrofolate reductase, partial [Candidatus Aminicenantes bacterium]|nr:methylenetetrahydrofolate reductase [Candidatus Aminicenantes bacterium]